MNKTTVLYKIDEIADIARQMKETAKLLRTDEDDAAKHLRRMYNQLKWEIDNFWED